jgi:hypothetical protein
MSSERILHSKGMSKTPHTNIIGAVSMITVPSVAPVMSFTVHHCLQPLTNIFALHAYRSTRFTRTSHCVGVSDASYTSNNGCGGPMALRKRERSLCGLNTALGIARIFFSGEQETVLS